MGWIAFQLMLQIFPNKTDTSLLAANFYSDNNYYVVFLLFETAKYNCGFKWITNSEEQ